MTVMGVNFKGREGEKKIPSEEGDVRRNLEDGEERKYSKAAQKRVLNTR